MDISELKGTVLQRFQELTDDEAGILQTLEQHPVGEVIMKLIGPELEQIFSEPESETEQMLADDMPNMPSRDQAFGGRMDSPTDEDMSNFEGRSQAGNTVPPLRRPQLENRKGEREMASR